MTSLESLQEITGTAFGKLQTDCPSVELDDRDVSGYPQLCVHLPPETLAKLRAISAALDLPEWRVLAYAIDKFLV